MTEKLEYGSNCFDCGYYNAGARGGFKDGIKYHSESQQDHLGQKFSFIGNSGIPYNSILFVGCATGNEPRYFREKGKEAFGCDISEFAIGQADPSIKNYIRQYDGRKLDWLGDNSVDAIGSFDCLTIVPKDVRKILVPEITRVCSKFITFRVTVKTRNDDPEWDGVDGYYVKEDPFDYWVNLFQENGVKFLKNIDYVNCPDHRQVIYYFTK